MAIQMQTSLEVADNSGARRVEMIMSIGGSTGRHAVLGDKIKVTVKEASPDGAVKKGTVQNQEGRHRAGDRGSRLGYLQRRRAHARARPRARSLPGERQS
jgi:hypothetical protein